MFKLEKLLGIRRGFILSLGLIASPIAAHSCIQSRNAAPQHQSNIIPCASALVSLHGFSCYSHQKQNSAVCSLQQNGPDGQCSEWITCRVWPPLYLGERGHVLRLLASSLHASDPVSPTDPHFTFKQLLVCSAHL